MTCRLCVHGQQFPLHACFGVLLHERGAGLPYMVCEDEQPPHYASHYAPVQAEPEPRLVEVRSFPYSGPYDQAMVEFHFADGSIKRLTDPDEIDEMRRRYRIKEGIGHGF